MRHRLGPAPIRVLLSCSLIGISCGGFRATGPQETVSRGQGRDRPVEATSLLDRPLCAPDLPAGFRIEQESLLSRALADLEAAPDDPDALIWVGRRKAYLGRYLESIRVYTKGIDRHPGDARFLRHRGHRYITTRKLGDAVRDLERAAELVRGRPDAVEPDGLPNARGIPTSTLQTNVWYHLGLARYVQGDFELALAAYRECAALSKNPDMLSASSHWLYMTLRRLGRDSEARAVLETIHAGMDVIENRDYHRLLLMYKGELEAETLLAEASEATAYGVGNWYLYNGDRDRAFEIFSRIVEGDAWAAFGYLAAEAELARLR